MIEFKNLNKTFSVQVKEPGLKGSLRSLWNRQYLHKQALHEVSATVQPGEIVGLVGANGAGKTTLVKILSGIVFPDSPESAHAKVLGFTPWDRKNEMKRQISLLMGQKPQLWWDLPASDCFILLKEIYQIPDTIYRQQSEELITELDIGDHLKTPIRKLSLGERMKMEITAALLHQPRVIFLDEPTIGLDLTSQRAIRNFLKTYQTRHQASMILTSHYMEDIEDLCERLMIMRKGELIYDGSMKHFFKQASQSKTVKVTWANLESVPTLNDLQKLSLEIISHEPEQLITEVLIPLQNFSTTLPLLIEQRSVMDLDITPEDISHLIERAMHGQSLDSSTH